ncbi:aldose 1-epimerase family protein [Lysinibacter cavernae]|uniref:Aldose 1-epimerase n=1 Tax=Lysinibacter cavernae TaxID=1640652 RepID=A0A7X5R173_9MICO|nr:aldose 1-epimerase [Lysinibacter cavernae]
MNASPTGNQYSIRRVSDLGDWSATITERAAGIRLLTLDGIDLVEPFPEDRVPPYAAGIVLMPWANRIRDGKWTLNGATQQLDITEPAAHNAIHGLLRNAHYTLGDRGADWVRLEAPVFPQHGYPFHLETSVTYRLLANGLQVTHDVRNVGPTTAPVALGAHPFVKIGDVPTTDLTLTVDAATRFEVDDRFNVLAEVGVEGTQYDLRDGVRLGDVSLDDGYGSVSHTEGETRHSITAPDGRRVTVWGDSNIRYVQVFTTDDFSTETVGDVAVAIEPMTAPAGSLATGEGLTWLEPGEEWAVRWGIRYS